MMTSGWQFIRAIRFRPQDASGIEGYDIWRSPKGMFITVAPGELPS